MGRRVAVGCGRRAGLEAVRVKEGRCGQTITPGGGVCSVSVAVAVSRAATAAAAFCNRCCRLLLPQVINRHWRRCVGGAIQHNSSLRSAPRGRRGLARNAGRHLSPPARHRCRGRQLGLRSPSTPVQQRKLTFACPKASAEPATPAPTTMRSQTCAERGGGGKGRTQFPWQRQRCHTPVLSTTQAENSAQPRPSARGSSSI